MTKFMKKCFMFFLLISMMGGISITAHAEEDKIVVEINEENFPDAVFREHILTGSHYIWDENNNQIEIVYDANHDGKLSESEISNIQQMLLQQKQIYDLTGIEYFTSLIELDCQWTQISSLDVSENTELQYLYCYRTNLAGTLDLSANTKLIGVNCSKNSLLENVIVNNCTELDNLDIESTGVSSIDLSDNSKLRAFSCGATPMKELDLSNNPALANFNCYNTKIQGLDVSNKESLGYLMTTGGSFVWLNVGDRANMYIVTSDGTADLSVPENGFDIAQQFPGIEAEKITIVSGGKLEGNIISGYEEGTPVVYTYNCGKANNKEIIITVTLNLTVQEEETPTTPDKDDKENGTDIPEDDEKNSNDSGNQGKNQSVPKTGDNSSIMVLLAGIAISVAIIMGNKGRIG